MTRSKSYLLDNQEVFKAESQRLSLQASKLFELERSSIQYHIKEQLKVILELGCGTGSFLNQLRTHFPGAVLHGVDRNDGLLAQARELIPSGNFVKMDLADSTQLVDLVDNVCPDLIVVRYVFQHISQFERETLLMTLSRIRHLGRRILIMDVDDSRISFQPESPALLQLAEAKRQAQKEAGGDRLVGAELKTLFERFGFSNIKKTEVIFSGRSVGWSSWKEIFFPVLLSGQRLLSDPISIIRSAEAWLASAEEDPDYDARFVSIHVSGD